MVTIYTKPNCAFCTKAKNLLNSRGIPFKALTLGEDFTREELLMWFPNVRTYPVIVNPDGRLVGGYEQLVTELTTEETSVGKSFLTEAE